MLEKTKPEESQENGLLENVKKPIDRRAFFKYAGATAAITGLVLSGCSDDDDDPDPSAVNLGSGDAGVLNYAYALEQLEAAFYNTIITHAAFATTFPDANERALLTDIAKHEAIHRDFFKAAINRDAPGKIIKDLTPDFSAINFTSRSSILGAAKAFEDLGVAAYNGGGAAIKTVAYLELAGKIVSVEARHAAFIRDLINNGDFASDDIVSATTGLDQAMAPTAVAVEANKYLTTKINADNVGK